MRNGGISTRHTYRGPGAGRARPDRNIIRRIAHFPIADSALHATTASCRLPPPPTALVVSLRDFRYAPSKLLAGKRNTTAPCEARTPCTAIEI